MTGAAGANSGPAATELGSSKNPIYMMQAEPTFKAQLWRTVRTLAVAFLIISGIGALFDERGLGKGILNNPDMKPQMESKTKFEDVKGVDEAKVQPCIALCMLLVPDMMCCMARHSSQISWPPISQLALLKSSEVEMILQGDSTERSMHLILTVLKAEHIHNA